MGSSLRAADVPRIRHHTSNLRIGTDEPARARGECYFLCLTDTGVEGPINGTLTVSSNDPDTPSLVIPWSANIVSSGCSPADVNGDGVLDNGDIQLFITAFLNGNQTPTIQSGETHFNILGMSWRGFWDYGIAEQDPKAMVKSTGAGS